MSSMALLVCSRTFLMIVSLSRRSGMFAQSMLPPSRSSWRKTRKEKHGKIYLSSAKKENGELEFIFGDDGKGIDFDKIRAKARKYKAFTLMDINNLDSQKLLKLIFHPGFTTADSAGISFGRGIGMNLVLSKLKTIGGKLRVSTKPGKGSEFIIRIPGAIKIAQKANPSAIGQSVEVL